MGAQATRKGYAATTGIDPERTQADIKALVKKRGAKSFGAVEDQDRAIVGFEMDGRRMRFYLPLPATLSEQQVRSRWRGLFLTIKAKLESVESGIETIDEAFLAQVVMPDGAVFSSYATKALAAAAQGKPMPPLVEGPR